MYCNSFLLVLAMMKLQPAAASQDLKTDAAVLHLTEVQTYSSTQCSYLKPPLVHIAFLNLIDQIRDILQLCDAKILMKECENLFACENAKVKLFSKGQIEKLRKCNSTHSLLSYLSFFCSWSNHFILRILLTKVSKKAMQLLDIFDSRLDPLQSISSYPIPRFSLNMIPNPNDTSMLTVLAIRCDQELYKCTLQYVYDVQSLVLGKCGITQKCLQLLAVRSDPTMFYWTIPNCVVKMISNHVPKHSEHLYSKGVLEVLVYPEPLLSTGDDVVMGNLAFISENKGDNGEVSIAIINILAKIHAQVCSCIYIIKCGKVTDKKLMFRKHSVI